MFTVRVKLLWTLSILNVLEPRWEARARQPLNRAERLQR